MDDSRSGRSAVGVWADLEDGLVTVFDRKTQASHFIRPYDAFPGSFVGPFDLSKAQYRFNWDSPISFAPVGRPHRVVRRQRGLPNDRSGPSMDADQSGPHAQHIREHQVPSGGPLAKDVSGAEYSDTILDIEGSPLTKGEIWVGLPTTGSFS